MAYGLEAIDWTQAWLAPWRILGQQGANWVDESASCAEALNQLAKSSGFDAVCFVDQSMLAQGQAYEAFIYSTKQVPTRNGLHDYFNGLCWLHFPQTKLQLNRLQAEQIALQGVAPVRGLVRDALTVFDENAALIQAPDAIWNALHNKNWTELFGNLRPVWSQVKLILFGHALLEKLVQPRKAITAHVYRVPQGLVGVQELDNWLAADLSAPKLAHKPFAHLPVLGVPGWCEENQNTIFYDDENVFRLPKNRKLGVQFYEKS